MNYYKLIDGNNFVGVIEQHCFRVFQQKHNILLSCNEDQAQYVQYGDVMYRADWMVPISTDRVLYKVIDIIRIEEDEYNILYEAIENEEEVVIQQEQPVFEEELIVDDLITEVTVEYVRHAKIQEMSYACNKSIEDGIDVTLNDGNIYHFSLTTQDQLNLITVQSMIASGETNIPYHADGELCRYYSVDDIAVVVDAATAHKTFHVTYFNSLKVYISSLDDIHDISAVRYGTEVPVEYQSDILKDLYASMVM